MSENTLMKQKQKRIQKGSTEKYVVEQSFKGPLPPPAILNGYERILPGSAERILAMAESEQRFRQKNDSDIVNKIFSESVMGMFLGSALAICLLYVGYKIIMFAPNNVAVVIAGSLFGLSRIVGVIMSLVSRNANK